MSEAFETLLQVHPAHAGHLDRPGSDGRHQIMVDEYEHEAMWLEKIGDTSAQRLPDQSQALLNLRLRLGEETSELTLYTHHALADAHHQFALLEKLFGWYTDIVSGAGVGPVKAEPIPESLESVLSERGIGKLQRFGLERYLPAMFAYDLPPSHRNAGRVGTQSFAYRRPPAGSPVRKARIWSTSVQPAGSVSTPWSPPRSCWPSGPSGTPRTCRSPTCTRWTCASS